MLKEGTEGPLADVDLRLTYSYDVIVDDVEGEKDHQDLERERDGFKDPYDVRHGVVL